MAEVDESYTGEMTARVMRLLDDINELTDIRLRLATLSRSPDWDFETAPPMSCEVGLPFTPSTRIGTIGTCWTS